MGLGFDQSNAQWSYGSFNGFRRKLAAQIGIDLDQMEGFRGSVSWEKFNDPLIPLLDHSDCEGCLTAEQCAQIGPRLLELIAAWDSTDFTTQHHRDNGIELANDMIDCGKRGVPLNFQ